MYIWGFGGLYDSKYHETEEFFRQRPKAEDEKNSEIEAGIYRHIAWQNPIYIIYIPFFKPLTQKNENLFSRLWLEPIILTPWKHPKTTQNKYSKTVNFRGGIVMW